MKARNQFRVLPAMIVVIPVLAMMAAGQVGDLNAKARAAKQGEPAAVSDLSDEIFARFGWANVAEVKDKIKPRLAAAQQDFYRTKQRGITDEDVEKCVNRLATELEAPQFARVTKEQVRAIRLDMLLRYPEIVTVKEKQQAGKSILSPQMSPLEAAFVTMALIHQKIYNPDFQEDPADWQPHAKQKQEEKWKQHGASGTTGLMVESESEKTKELRSSVNKMLKNKPQDQLISLPDSLLDELGINRKDQK
jgi:hypothetical protein